MIFKWLSYKNIIMLSYLLFAAITITNYALHSFHTEMVYAPFVVILLILLGVKAPELIIGAYVAIECLDYNLGLGTISFVLFVLIFNFFAKIGLCGFVLEKFAPIYTPSIYNRNIFSGKGRINRLAYFFNNLAINVLIIIICCCIGGIYITYENNMPGLVVTILFILGLVVIFLLALQILNLKKRLYDILADEKMASELTIFLFILSLIPWLNLITLPFFFAALFKEGKSVEES